jgi:hypothetical protein
MVTFFGEHLSLFCERKSWMTGRSLFRGARRGSGQFRRMRDSHPLEDVAEALVMRKIRCGSTGRDPVFLQDDNQMLYSDLVKPHHQKTAFHKLENEVS